MRTLEVECDQPPRGDDELGPAPPLHPAVEDDARVYGAVVVGQEAVDGIPARLLLAVAHDAKGHGRCAFGDERFDRLQLHPELTFVVRDAARVQPFPASLGREGLALPELERVGRLDVVVAVDEDRRRARRPSNVAHDEAPALADLGIAAEASNRACDPLGRPGDVT